MFRTQCQRALSVCSTLVFSPSPLVPRVADGVSRELYALLQDESLPSLVPTTKPQPTSFRQRKKGGVKWEWKAFSSTGRKDKAQFRHWWKKHENPDDYSFAKFNKKPRLISYTKSEFEQLRAPSWSKEETDHLVRLCDKFEMRWHVIFDRYQQVEHNAKAMRWHDRSVEDLKDRYFSLVKRINPQLLPYQFLADGDGHSAAGGQHQVRRAIGYDPNYERQRKAKLRIFYSRSGAQEASDGELTKRAKDIEESRKKRAREGTELAGSSWSGAATKADIKAVEMCDEALVQALGGNIRKA
jgi:DNA methyltransferase 1-associated protein 1